jgi:hypothetical protein
MQQYIFLILSGKDAASAINWTSDAKSIIQSLALAVEYSEERKY